MNEKANEATALTGGVEQLARIEELCRIIYRQLGELKGQIALIERMLSRVTGQEMK